MRGRVFLIFLLICLMWSSTYVVIKIGLEYSTPLVFAGMRMTLAGLFMTAVALATQKARPRLADLRQIFGMSLGNISAFSILLTLGLTVAGAGEASILVYTQPLFVAVLAALFLKERLPAVRILGLVSGFVGMALVVSGGLGHIVSSALPEYLGLLLAAAGWAVATVYFRSHPLATPLIWTTALQLLLGGLTVLVVTVPFERVRITWTPAFLMVLIYMAVIGIALPYALWFKLLEQRELSGLAAYLFMTPLFATLLGVLFRGEAVVPIAGAGAALTLAGIYAVNRPAEPAFVRGTPVAP